MRITILFGMFLLVGWAEAVAQESSSARPEHVVQRQFDAYNRHDAEGFAAAFAADAEVRTLGDTGATRGRAALREDMAAWFKKAPKVHAILVERMVHGSFVVDHERVTGIPNGKVIEAIGIYEVRNGAITRVWWTP